jgi:CheY-like chemotaxis protein
MPNILIVDDNPGIRKEIRQRLESAGLAVCGEAADGIEAIEKAPALRPDLVILDAAMPRLNGIDAAGRLKQLQPDLPIVLHTFHADLIRSQTLPAGVSEIVAKGEPLIPRVLNLLAKPHSNQRRRSR